MHKVEVLLTGSPGEVEAPVGRQAVGAISAEADQEGAAIDGEWGEARRPGYLTTPNTRNKDKVKAKYTAPLFPTILED